MEQVINFKICPDYNREQFDFDEIQRDRHNPLDSHGIPVYPILMSSSQGSSFTYKISNEWFFKRKLQDGGNPLEILSQHHHSQAYNELSGSFDDLAEVLCYFLAQGMIDSKTGKPLVDVCEYRLATYCDKEGIKLRGCISKNLCMDPNDTLISMADILNSTSFKNGRDLDVYMAALKEYCERKKIKCDYQKTRQTLILNSRFCHKVKNSDNHKNNVTFIIHKESDGTYSIAPSALIDNGSAYEMSAPYISGGSANGESKFDSLMKEDAYTMVDADGNKHFCFPFYPHMHTAFFLSTDSLLFEDTRIDGKHFTYEYSLASEMLSDPELYRKVFEMEKQFDLNAAIDMLDRTYGSDIRKPKKMLDWPPLLKEYMFESNNCDSKILETLLADYYTYAAYSQCVAPVDRQNPTEQFEALRQIMLTIPLQRDKESYDEIFMGIAHSMGIKIDPEKLKTIRFKKEVEFKKPEQQPQ